MGRIRILPDAVANPEVVKTLVATDDPHTAGNSMTIGEVGTYQLLVTLPEASNNGFRVSDELPDGRFGVIRNAWHDSTLASCSEPGV